MATAKKDGDREAELEAAIEAIRKEIWKPGQTLPKPGDCVDPAGIEALAYDDFQSMEGSVAKIEVFHFRVYDPGKDDWIMPFRKSPKKRIEEVVKGEIIPHTGEFVDVSDLDSQERYDPNKKGQPF